MKLDALLRAHGFMKVEWPPEIWEADTEDTRFVPLLGEMIAAALAGGGELAQLTLNASNLVVPVDDDDADRSERIDSPPFGDFVAITVSGCNRSWPRRPVAPGSAIEREAPRTVARSPRGRRCPLRVRASNAAEGQHDRFPRTHVVGFATVPWPIRV
jgi:hypothetical protein